MTECQAELALALRSALFLAISLFFSPRLEFSSSSWLLHCVCATITFHSLFLSARAQNHNHTHTHAHMHTHEAQSRNCNLTNARRMCCGFGSASTTIRPHSIGFSVRRVDFGLLDEFRCQMPFSGIFFRDYHCCCHSAARCRSSYCCCTLVPMLTSVNAQFDRRVKLFIRCLCYGSDLLCLMCWKVCLFMAHKSSAAASLTHTHTHKLTYVCTCP